MKLSYLRNTLLDLSLIFLIDPHKYLAADFKADIEILIGSLNLNRFKDVIEERMCLKKCCNLECGNLVEDKHLA